MLDVETLVGKHLHGFVFFDEFTFSNTLFPINGTGEGELADAVVFLGGTMMVFQIKERNHASFIDEDSERRWFKAKVLKEATRQIRTTMEYLSSAHQLLVPNQRGKEFDLAVHRPDEVIKVVLYKSHPSLPAECRGVHFHRSDTAGFIHIINVDDYLQLTTILRVPFELFLYFRYRERALTKFTELVAGLPEACIAGQFVTGRFDDAPTAESFEWLHKMKEDDHSWDISHILEGMRDGFDYAGYASDYYEILEEFAKLPRSSWRLIKERILRSLEKVDSDEWTEPYRIVCVETNCGFTFVPVHSELTSRADWNDRKLNYLAVMTRAHKYDCRLNICVGLLIYKSGEQYCIDWCLDHEPWQYNAEMAKALEERPLRKVRLAEIEPYHFE
jgi:hypothetical protein